MGNHDFLEQYHKRFIETFLGVSRGDFSNFVTLLKSTLDRGASIYVFGNGGSGTAASHFAADVNKGVSYGKKKRYKVICLNDNMATISAYANDVSYDDAFVESLKNFLTPGDLVLAISGSGNSENVLRAIRYAGEVGAATFGLTGSGGKLSALAQASLVVPSKDMQTIEDIHLHLLHCAMRCLCEEKTGPAC